MANINEERIKKFKDMGIPLPMAPVDPSSLHGPAKNIEFAKKLQAIKNGTKKEELNTFIEKEKAQAGFMPLELPAKKNVPGKTQQKAVMPEGVSKPAVTGPSFDAYEKALFGDNTPSSNTYETASNPRVSDNTPSSNTYETASNPRVNYTSDIVSDNGTNFLTDLKSRLAEKFTKASNGQVVLNTPGGLNKDVNGQIIPSLNENVRIKTATEGYKFINENELKETITQISSKLIKKFMSEFLTAEPSLIKESEKIKKAEIIREDIVKIDGKFFKLTPVTLKKK